MKAMDMNTSTREVDLVLRQARSYLNSSKPRFRSDSCIPQRQHGDSSNEYEHPPAIWRYDHLETSCRLDGCQVSLVVRG